MEIAEPDYFGKRDPRNMPQHFFWKVRRDYSSAQKANVSKQNFSVAPRFWYIDATARCKDCHEYFDFTADEQRFWYEEMKFYVDSFPTRCLKCRRSKRTLIELRKQYDNLIAEALTRKKSEKALALRLINEIEALQRAIPNRMIEKRRILIAQLAKMQAPESR